MRPPGAGRRPGNEPAGSGVLRNARLAGPDAPAQPVDVAFEEGRITAVGPGLAGARSAVDAGGRLVVPGLVETHIHLDKACLLDRCRLERGTLDEAIATVSAAKRGFTVEDVHERAGRTLERCILAGTMRMRTHVEVDPTVGLAGFEAVRAAARERAWAIDVEICVFPQEGLLCNPGTEELMVEALRRGARVVGGCPYTDRDPIGQIERVFELAREFDADVDFHLDFDTDPEGMTAGEVCEQTERHGWQGRVAIGHVTKLSALAPPRLAEIAARLAAAGVAVTVLPATDLYLTGGEREHDVVRGVAPLHRLLEHGVNGSIATNNVLNPFTPYGDASLTRAANLFANVARLGTPAALAECLGLITHRAAALMRLPDYGIRPGNPADLVVLDCDTPEAAVAEVAWPLLGLKRGRRTFTRAAPVLHPPHGD